MRNKVKAAHDVFTFSRRGLTVIASHTVAPVIGGDRINKARDEHVRRTLAARNHRTWGNPDCRPGSAGMPQAA